LGSGTPLREFLHVDDLGEAEFREQLSQQLVRL